MRLWRSRRHAGISSAFILGVLPSQRQLSREILVYRGSFRSVPDSRDVPSSGRLNERLLSGLGRPPSASTYFPKSA